MGEKKCLQLSGMRVEGHDVTEDEEEGVNWVEATRNVRRLRSKLHDMKWPAGQWQTKVWNDASQYMDDTGTIAASVGRGESV